MVLWFLAIGLTGLVAIIGNPSGLMAISPRYGLESSIERYQLAFITLGAILLCVSGAEALYAPTWATLARLPFNGHGSVW